MSAFTQWWPGKAHRAAQPLAEEHAAGSATDDPTALLQLQIANKRLKRYIDRAPLACIAWGLDRIVRAWNPAAEAMFGYSAAEAIGRNVYDLIGTPSGIAVANKVRDAVLSGVDHPDGVVVENRRKDGSSLHCHWHFALIEDDEGVIAFALDVSDKLRVQHERELMEASLRKAQRMQSLGALAGGIAHDFNNILLAICGNAKLAADDLPIDHPARVSLAEVDKAAARAAVIVNQILALSRPEDAVSADGAGSPAPVSEVGRTNYELSTNAPRGDGQSILYVDDEEPLVYLITRVLERLGYRVTGFTDARRALAVFQADPQAFEVVVTDLSMPGMSGIELARRLLQIRPQLPVVMTSGYVRPEDRASLLSTGVRELLLKPNTVEELGEVLHRLLHAARQSRS